MLLTKGKAFLPVFALAVLGVTACSTPETGNPSPVASSSASSQATSGSASANGNALASVDACSLLTDQEATQFKAQGPGHPDPSGTTGTTSTCQRTGRSANNGSTSFTVSVRAEQGLAEMNSNGGALTTGSLNGRPAAQFVSNIGAKCLVSLGVTPTSRVDISFVVAAGTEPTEACQTASNIANIVEPKLPKYEG